MRPNLALVPNEAPSKQLTKTAARAITKALKLACDNAAALAIQAWKGRVWIALGYASWNLYCEAEQINLPRDCGTELRDAGMSSRAAASAMGVSHMTASRDFTSPVPAVTNVTAGTPARTIGLDGKNYPARLTQEQRQERTERRVAIMVSTRGICHSWTAEEGLQNGGLQEVEQLVTKGIELTAEERQELIEVFDKYIALMSQFKETWGFIEAEGEYVE